MRHALRLAEIHSSRGEGGPFGAVVVRGDRVVGRGWNRVVSKNDPTAHAEIVAIQSASRALRDFSLRGCRLFATCEPCPMCLSAAYWARVDEIIYAADRADAAAIGFDDARMYGELSRVAADRSLPMRRCLPESAQAMMLEWADQPDRVIY